MQAATAVDPSDPDWARALLAPGLQALLLSDPPRPAWFDELDRAVREGDFHIPRSDLAGVEIDRMATWLDHNMPHDVSPAARDGLISDILGVAHLVEDLTSARWYKLRIFTAVPDRRCGFHVDTVPPDAPAWGALRVYNGEGTDWVAPSAVRSMAAFYHWLQRRDRIVRVYPQPGRDARLEQLDRCPEFLTEGAQIQEVPSGTTVIFRHLPASAFWSDHPPDQAWIHCSPMQGTARLVVNISPDRRRPGAYSSGRGGRRLQMPDRSA